MPRTMGIKSGEPAQTEREMIDKTEANIVEATRRRAKARLMEQTPPHSRVTQLAMTNLGLLATELTHADPETEEERHRGITVVTAHSPSANPEPTEPFRSKK